MLPFFYLCRVLFQRRNVPSTLVITLVGILTFFSSADNLLATPVWGLLLLQVVSWLPFVTLTRHYCYSWDLNLNRK